MRSSIPSGSSLEIESKKDFEGQALQIPTNKKGRTIREEMISGSF
jgi:hypothetical protein